MTPLAKEGWHYIRTYVMSNRTNPTPAQFVESMSGMMFSSAELNSLHGALSSWPGGPNAAVSAALNDLLNVRTSG